MCEHTYSYILPRIHKWLELRGQIIYLFPENKNKNKNKYKMNEKEELK